MYAVMLAVFPNHQAAEAVRAELFEDGFPADRLDVTSMIDEGPARVEQGAATLTVHRRGDREVARAHEIVKRARPLSLEARDLDKPSFEFAASPSEQSMLGKLIEDVTGESAESTGLSRKP